MMEREMPKLTLLEEAQIQAKVLVPLLRAFRAELGTARANQIAREALYAWWVALAQQGTIEPDAPPLAKLMAARAAKNAAFAPNPTAYDMQLLEQGEDRLAFNITGCRYAEFFRALGEPELGFMLLCNGDYAVAEAAGVTLERTGTLMQGADHCDFRWRGTETPSA